MLTILQIGADPFLGAAGLSQQPNEFVCASSRLDLKARQWIIFDGGSIEMMKTICSVNDLFVIEMRGTCLTDTTYKGPSFLMT